MRFLKKKIEMCQKSLLKSSEQRKVNNNTNTQIEPSISGKNSTIETKIRTNNRCSRNTPQGSTSCKNIMKNYSRALTRFALSELARPYLGELLKEENITLDEFHKHIKQHRSKVHCIKNLRELLLVEKEDSASLASYKKIFQRSSEIFIKFFSANWIFESRIADKIVHLKYRFKILRRIRNPQNFTYLKNVFKI